MIFAIAKTDAFLIKYELPCPKTGRTRLKTAIETNKKDKRNGN